MSDVAAPPGGDIAANAARIGHYVWLSARLFEVAGSWVASTIGPGEKIVFADASSRFAWQAAEWHRRLPRLREVDRAALVTAPGRATLEASDRLTMIARPDRRSTLAAIIDGLEQVYRIHGEAASPVRDGPVLRSIGRIRADLSELDRRLGDIDHT